MASLLKVEQLRKHFNGLEAVRGISFDVQEGRCLGLLGPNGAGKTTTVEMLEGIQTPDGGSVSYRGKPLDESFRNRAGIMFQSTALQDFITVEEALQLFARFYPRITDLPQLIEDCSLGELLGRDASKLSGGQRQRLLLAISLVNDPDIIFLDEPTTGLDPQARHNFWQLVNRVKQRNKTIVLTTHYMEEAYELCDEIIIMDHGEIIAQGTPQALLAHHFGDVVIDLPEGIEEERVVKALGQEFEWSIGRHGGGMVICTSDITHTVSQLLKAAIPLQGMQIRARTLEDLFLELTGKALRK